MMEIEKLLSVWSLSSNGECLPVSHMKIISDFEAILPTERGQNLLDQLVIDGLVEVNCFGEYILTKRGLKIRKQIPDVPKPKVLKRTGHEWDRFRKVLSYYIDCVHLQERTQEYLRYSELNRHFFIPILPSRWLTGFDGEKTIRIPIDEKNKAAAQLLLTRRDDDEEIYLGYPLSVFPLKDGKDSCCTPMGLIPVDITSANQKEMYFELRLEETEINQTWLEYAFPREENKDILNTILRLHANDEHRGQIDLLQALPLLQKDVEFNPNSLVWNLPVLKSGEKGKTCNSAILFIGHSLRYSKTLKRELKYIRDKVSDEDLDTTALAYIFREPVLPAELPEKPFMPLPFIDSNPEQMAAIEAALNSPSVKITGPPGTGKSQVAVNIIANLIYNGKSVLFSSKNHKAIEAIWNRSQQIIPERGLSLVNFCTQQDPNPWYKQDLDFLMASAGAVTMSPADDSIQCLADYSDRWYHITKHYGPRRAVLSEYENWLHEDQNNQAAMARLFSHVHHRTLNDHEFKQLKKCISHLADPPKFNRKEFFKWIKWHTGGAAKNTEARKYLCDNFPDVLEQAVSLEEIVQKFMKFESLFDIHCKLQEKKHSIEKKAQESPDIHKGVQQLNESMQKISKLTASAILSCRCRKIKELMDNPDLVNRLKNIMNFMKTANSPAFFQRLKTEEALQAETGFKIFSQYYPGWAVTLLSLTKASPCIAHLFDTVIIDEASQCDPASVIPALFRAKSVVFVGDSNQFPPVITMRPLRNDFLKSKNQITDIEDQRFDFLETSAFDLSSESPILLQEHFRCAPEIAEYFNSTFYANKLHIRTDETRLQTPDCIGNHHAVEWIDIHNSKAGELKAAKETLNTLLKNKYAGSIGIVTPFREYAENLRQELYSLTSSISETADDKKNSD